MQYQKYLRLLAKEYPTARLARGEIIRLAALRELPKGTEYFSRICTVRQALLFIAAQRIGQYPDKNP